MLDIPLDEEASTADLSAARPRSLETAKRPAPRSPEVDAASRAPASGVRSGGSRAAQVDPATVAERARPAAAASSGGAAESELADQRIRQIYAKYVETKRSTQESTAGVTFEKLAASLRAQATKLKSAHPSKSIDYEVVVKDGKTHLKPVLR